MPRADRERREKARLVVVGIGNEAMQDDGLGVRLLGELRKRDLPEGVELVALGPDPLDFLSLAQEADSFVFLDAVCSGANAGTIHKLDIEEAFPVDGRTVNSLHHLGLGEAVRMARAVGKDVSAVVLGVECKSIGPGQELSAELSELLPQVADRTAGEILKIYKAVHTSLTKVS